MDDVGGLRPERDGAQDHDLVLRLTEQTSAIRHIPAVLYSWRQSADLDVDDTRRKAVGVRSRGARRAGRAGPTGDSRGGSSAGAFPGGYRVRYELRRSRAPGRDPHPHPGPGRPVGTVYRVRSRRTPSTATTPSPSSTTTAVNAGRSRLSRASGLKVVDAGGPFNYSAIINRGFASTDVGVRPHLEQRHPRAGPRVARCPLGARRPTRGRRGRLPSGLPRRSGAARGHRDRPPGTGRQPRVRRRPGSASSAP